EGEPLFYPYGSGPGTWQILTIIPDSIHPGQFDPGETMNISVVFTGSDPLWVQASTSSGVSDSAYIR
ncbi:MAG TPA: hypothetical protein VE134_06725, partial [Methanomicrobiales archaeon]|nr:hypothetical protein [Methanomicrobiales archaeon]